MLDINDKILVFSGFKTNQDLVQKTGVPLVCQITNGTASFYHSNITAAPITNPLIEKEVYYGNVVRSKRLLRTANLECCHHQFGIFSKNRMVVPIGERRYAPWAERREDAKMLYLFINYFF